MRKYIFRRLLGMLLVLLIVSFVVFLFIHILPGDPAQMLAGEDATQAQIDTLTKQLGLDQPLLVQYKNYLLKLLRLDLGTSMRTSRPVHTEIASRYRVSIVLALSSLWFIPLGLLAGIIAAVNKGRKWDFIVMILAISGISVPSFWLGLMLMELFATKLHWFNAVGYEQARDLILPSITLGVAGCAMIARFTRSSFLAVLSENYIDTARAKGLGENLVLLKHALKNAILPIITVIGLQVGFLIAGTIVVESVFALPGMGRFLVDSVTVRDYPAIQAILLLYTLHFVVINFLVDMLYAVFNPQIRLK